MFQHLFTTNAFLMKNKKLTFPLASSFPTIWKANERTAFDLPEVGGDKGLKHPTAREVHGDPNHAPRHDHDPTRLVVNVI